MRRGFKAHAKRLAVEVRAEADQGIDGPIDPWALLETYGIRVYTLSSIDCSQDALRHLTGLGQSVFSGALIPYRNGAVVLDNDSHALVRRRSTMSHELAHVVLEHAFATSIVNERGCRIANGDQEEEATELSGELLVPFDAAVRLARADADDAAVADQFMISERAAGWRMNGSGARTVAARRRAARARRHSGV